MKNNLGHLLQKRKQLEQKILEAKQLEKRKMRAQQIAIAVLERYPRAVLADEHILLERLEAAFSEIAQNLPAG